jgi:hypothetical protein
MLSRNVGGALAVPVRLTAGAVFEALLVNVTLPVYVPEACGANCTVTLVDAPVATVNGNAGDVTLNTAPLTVACDTVRFAFPVLLTITACDDVVVAGMLLNVIEVGETPITAPVTVTVAEADFVVSATLVALTV